MTQEPLYHCLSASEWVRVVKLLTYSEVKVFYYILTSNPMGDRPIDCRIRTIAKALEISTGSVSNALKSLDRQGLIQMEVKEARISVKPRLISNQAQKILDRQQKSGQNVSSSEPLNDVQPTEHDVQPTEHDVQPTEHDVQPTEHVIFETLSTQGFQRTHDDQTYIDFKDSLSDSEREKFLDFVRKEIKNFARPISDLEAWLASQTKAGENRWEIYYEKFKEREERALSRPSLSQEIEERRQRILAKKRAESQAKTESPNC
jgi:DNA-binding MarR family transcriptional regulator